MSSWTERMQERAATLGNAVVACTLPSPYPRRMDKVKFGVPLAEVCKHDIPGPLLILILKLNKEAPYKKDVFRAPGHQGNMKKLIHFLNNGRLVNIDNFSVYTIASVLKKFLRKLPEGIFGREGERELFQVIEMDSLEEQRDLVHTLIASLPLYTQRLIVLLFGTFRVIASNSDKSQTGMSSEAMGVCVAPSFFHSCIQDGKTAKMDDVRRFKAEVDMATRIVKFLIDNFGVSNLFGRENYEYYARITGRILKVEEEWIFSFRYPPEYLVNPSKIFRKSKFLGQLIPEGKKAKRQMSLAAEQTWLQFESERWGLKFNLEAMSQQEESQSTPALLQSSERLDVEAGEPSSSLTIIPENNLLESYTRLSISLEDNGLFQDTIDNSSRSSSNLNMTLDELRAVNHYAESTKSLTFLPQVHERQAARMKTRSEWFLSPSPGPNMPLVDIDQDLPTQYYILREETMANRNASGGFALGGSLFSSSAESLKYLVRRSSSKEKDRRLVRRTSSKKNKENGNASSNGSSASNSNNKSKSCSTSSPSQQPYPNQSSSSPSGLPADSTLSRSSNIANFNELTTTTAAGSSEKVVAATTTPKRNTMTTSATGAPDVIDSDTQPLVSEDDCTETDVQTFHVTLTYKPRI